MATRTHRWDVVVVCWMGLRLSALHLAPNDTLMNVLGVRTGLVPGHSYAARQQNILF